MDCGICLLAARSFRPLTSDGLDFLILPAPFLTMGIGSFLAHLGMSRGKQQCVRVTNLRFNQPQVAGGIKQAWIPALPLGQKIFDLFAEIHRTNVYEVGGRDNDPARGFEKSFRRRERNSEQQLFLEHPAGHQDRRKQHHTHDDRRCLWQTADWQSLQA